MLTIKSLSLNNKVGNIIDRNMSIIESSGKDYAIHLTKDVVLPKVVEYLQTKYPEFKVNVEELMEVFTGESSPRGIESRSPEEGSSSDVIRPKTSAKSTPPTKTSVTKKPTPDLIYEKPEEGVKCIYMFTRGKKEGSYCGKPCVTGLKYCKYCKNKRKKEPSSKRKSAKTKTPPTKKEEEPTVTVEIYRNIDKHFLHSETNFILREDDQTICAIAKELENGEIRSLTEDEKTEARKYTLVTIKDEEKEKEALTNLRGLIGKDEIEVADEPVSGSYKPIPVTEEPLITKKASKTSKVPLPVLPEVPEVPSI